MKIKTNILTVRFLRIIIILVAMASEGCIHCLASEQATERVIYSTDFQDWEESLPIVPAKAIHKETTDGQALIFSLNNITVDPTGTNSKFTGSCITLGYMQAEKEENNIKANYAYFETSVLKSVTKIKFIQAATGKSGGRGWNLLIREEGATRWDTIHNKAINTTAGEELSYIINRKNVQLRFYNRCANQFAFITSLEISGEVTPPQETIISYYDTDGNTLIGKQTITKEANTAKDFPMLTYQYGAKDVTVNDGNVFRGWFNSTKETATKIHEGSELYKDICLYAKATPEEMPLVGTEYIYDFTKPYWYQEDHEVINIMNGAYHNSHGWKIEKNGTIQIQVAQQSVIQVTLCNQSNKGTINVTDEDGNTVSSFASKASTDGTIQTINYQGSKPTTLTLTMSATTYIHGIGITNFKPVYISFKFPNDKIEGKLPEAIRGNNNNEATMPTNAFFYREGWTFVGWTDGINIYDAGTKYTFNEDITLTPKMVENTIALTDINTPVSVVWPFDCTKAPAINVSNNNTEKAIIYTMTPTVEGEKHDVELRIDASSGRLDNTDKRINALSNGAEGAVVNDGTKFTVPAVYGMTVKIHASDKIDTQNLGVMTKFGVGENYSKIALNQADSAYTKIEVQDNGKTLLLTYNGDATKLELSVKKAGTTQYTFGFFKDITVIYPVLPNVITENFITDKDTDNFPNEKPKRAGSAKVEGSTSYPNTGSRFKVGDIVTIVAHPNYGYTVKGYRVKGSNAMLETKTVTDATTQETLLATDYTVTEGITTIEVIFERKTLHKITAQASDTSLGTVLLSPIYENFYKEVYETANNGKQGKLLRKECWYTEGTEVTVSVETAVECVVDYWTKDESTAHLSEANIYTFTIDNTDHTVIAHLKKGEIGTVVFDISNAHVNGATPDYKGAASMPIETISNVKSFTVPTNYTFYKNIDNNDQPTDNGYTLLYWIDKEDNNRYDIGNTYSFKKKKITLTPVFEYNSTAPANRINTTIIRYDFGRKPHLYEDPASQEQRKVSAQAVEIGNNKKTFWTTKAHIDVLQDGKVASYDRDVAMWCNTGSKGYIRNTDLEDWGAFGLGTTFWCYGGVGTKISILTYSKITTTTIDGTVPTLDTERTDEERLKAGLPTLAEELNSGKKTNLYVYSYTTNNTAERLPIIIGDDYSYYQWIEVIVRAANIVNLHTKIDNTQHGNITSVTSTSDYGVTDTEDGGYAVRQGDRIKVDFERLFGYELDKIVDANLTDSDGNPLTLLQMGGKNDDTVKMIDFDGSTLVTVSKHKDEDGNDVWGSAAGDQKTVFVLSKSEPTKGEFEAGKRTHYEIEFNITNHRSLEICFKEKPTYYITFNAGQQASGVPPVAEWVEAGDKYIIPKNKTLYYEGNTLAYWVDSEYKESMRTDEKDSHIYHIDSVYTAPAKDLRLMPVFAPNSFNILDLVKEETAIWHFTTNAGAPDINYEGTAGILVTQLKNNSQHIDLKLDLNAIDEQDADGNVLGRGKFNNTSNNDRIQINGRSSIYFPSTPECVAQLTAQGDPSGTVVADKKKGDNGYTAESKSIAVTCPGDSAYEKAYFTNTVYAIDFNVTYKPQKVGKATISTLTCGSNTIDNAEIQRQMKAHNHITFKVSSWDAAKEEEKIPAVTGTATMGGTVSITAATVTNKKCVATVYTAGGIVVETYPIIFELETPSDNPQFKEIYVNDVKYTDTTNEIFNVSRSGIVRIVFNRTMKAANIISRDTVNLHGDASGNEITFKYWDAPAGATILLSASPEQGIFKDIYDKTCQQTLSLKLHIITDQNYYQHASFDFIVGQDGSIDDAINAANSNTKTNNQRYYIFVPNGEYQLNGNQSNSVTLVSKSNISLIGQSKEGVQIWNQPITESISNTATIHLDKNTTDFYAEDLILENRFDYWGSSSSGAGRAVVFRDQGNRSILKNVSLSSYQDTYYSNNAKEFRGYLENCDISGVVDFICGDGDIWFEKCNIILRDRSNNNIAAPSTQIGQQWGYVFSNCHIKPEIENPQLLKNYDWTLARPWGGSPACTYLNTKMSILPKPTGWARMNTDEVLRLHEYRSMDAEGILLSLGGRSLSACSPAAGSDNCVLSDEDALNYTIRNVLGGTDGFEPNMLCQQIDAASAATAEKDENSFEWQDNIELDDDILQWNECERALCYFIFKSDANGNWIYKTNTTGTSINLTNFGSGYYCVRAANQRGGLGSATKRILFTILDPYELEIKHQDALSDDGTPYGWSTICLPFNAKVPKEVTAYAATAHDKTTDTDKITDFTMTLTPVEIIDSIKGYIVYGPVGTHYFKPTSRSCNKETILSGNPTKNTISATNISCYVLANKAWGIGFYKYTGSSLSPYRAWLPQNMVSTNIQEILASGQRAIRFIFADGTNALPYPLYYHIDKTDSTVYTTDGLRLKSPVAPGIYISRGKGKFIKK